MKKLLVFLLFLLGFNNVYSQTIDIFNVNAEGFPLVKAYIFGSDLSPSNVMLTENGLERKITKVTCPSPKQPVPISSVLTVDVSGSMKNGGFKIAKTALSAWVRALNLMVDECAITSFDNYNYLNQDFTTDPNKLLSAIDSLKPKGSTDYDYALINKMSGALLVSKAGQYKKVIILMTDGLPEKEPQVTRIIATAKQQGCEIYSVVIGMSCPQSLKDISEKTGGLWFDNVYTLDEAQSIYFKILRIARGLEPCEIEWESDLGCQLRLTNVRVYQGIYMGQTNYQPPEISLAKLELTPNFIYFGGVQPGKIKDTTMILKAINGDFKISDIKVSLGPKVYSLRNVAFPINLKQGDSEIIDIRYEPQDSSIYFTSFTIETDVCRRTLNMIGGFGGHALPENPLKLTCPNGGEKFVIGSDTLITWEGVYESDTVSLEYSIDNGKTWTFITDTATGLKYIWKNIPPPTSNECLIKVKLIKK
ncbi:MAG: VWA domain-containing protein [bacterium]